MNNSDYLIKATIKKLSEKVNKTFLDRFDEATSVAQEVPDLLRKELEILIDEIIDEAKIMEENNNEDTSSENSIGVNKNFIDKSRDKITKINNQLTILNKKLDN